MLSTRNSLNKALSKLANNEETAVNLTAELEIVSQKIIDSEMALLIMQKAAKLSQDHLAKHLSLIVSQAIQAVIDKPYVFVCEFVERRGATEADLYLVKNFRKYDILAGTGGGLADVISFSLKVAYLLLSNVDRVLIIDEVSRHINSPDQREAFAEVLVRLSQEFNIQMIINSAIPELTAVADKLFTLNQVNEETVIS